MSTIAQVAAAFTAGKPARCHNARTDGRTYWLHNSAIAKHVDGGGIVGDWCGFYTPTTANHLRKIRDACRAPVRISYANARDLGVREFCIVVPF